MPPKGSMPELLTEASGMTMLLPPPNWKEKLPLELV